MHSFFMYILECTDGTYYVGHTDNLEKRLSEHQLGTYACYTKSRLPVKIVFMQLFNTRDAAFKAERKIKKWGHEKKKALIKKDWNQIALLAKRKLRSNS